MTELENAPSELTPLASAIRGTKRPGRFRIVSLGDVHLGHHKTPTTTIIKNLDTYCTNDRVLKDVDMLVITGDLFDRLLHNASDDVHQINRWITRLMFRCARLDVAIRIVEGTPSHDRMQSRFFIEQRDNANIPVDLHYATTLSIEYVERFGIHILYVPDKWRADTNETLQEVKLLLKKHQLDRVDFAIMHGAFEYQLPAVVKEPTHDSAEYMALVRYFVLIGHVHFPNPRERILPAGSFDRLCHNEEGPKGYFDITIKSEDDYTITFVENQGAKRYDTLDCRGMDTKQANVAIRKATAELPKGSSIRLYCDRHSPVVGDLDTIKQQYPDFEWATPKIEDAERDRNETLDRLMKMDLEEFAPIDPTTILALTRTELERHAGDAAAVARCEERLQEIIA